MLCGGDYQKSLCNKHLPSITRSIVVLVASYVYISYMGTIVGRSIIRGAALLR